MHLSIDDIAKYTAGSVVEPGRPGGVAYGITWDSREVEPGFAYVALPGARVDGHDFAMAAADAGAACVLASRPLEKTAVAHLRERGCALVQVADTAAAFVDLARAWRGYLDGTVVGITGSSGKTTTKNLVRDVLASAMKTSATKANQNNELGVPRTVLDAPEDADAVVVEMGMRGQGQIAKLCEFVRPDMGLITNVGTSHIELLGSREAIARAKGELLDALPHGGIAFLNANDDFTGFLLEELRLEDRDIRPVFYAGPGDWDRVDDLAIFANGDPFVWADEVRYDAEGRPTFKICAYGFGELGLAEVDGFQLCTLQLRGAHNVTNACAAAAVGLALGMGLPQCCRALEQAQPEQGRQQVLRTPGGVTVVDDSYNANPDSMRASLSMFVQMDVPGRRIAVLGDMGELGSYAAEGHALVGAAAAKARLDALVCVGALAAGIAQAAREAGFPPEAIDEVATGADALALLAGTLTAGDAVLVKASHAMELDKVVEGLMA